MLTGAFKWSQQSSGLGESCMKVRSRDSLLNLLLGMTQTSLIFHIKIHIPFPSHTIWFVLKEMMRCVLSRTG